jgi:hypothetical protein
LPEAELPTDLARVVEAWDSLDDPTRRVILALAGGSLPLPIRVSVQTLIDAAGRTGT